MTNNRETENVDGLKQRIVGALVLVALAVIFVPMVFDEPHSGRTSTSITIPEEPPFPEVDGPYDHQNEPVAAIDRASSEPDTTESAPGYRLVEPEPAPAEPASEAPVQPASEPEQSTAVTSAPVVPEVVKPVPKAPASAPEEKESIDYSGSLAGAWVVQMGSFGNADNARRLRDKVRAKGYGSHLQDVVRGDTRLTRVFSGPFATKADAEAAKRALDKAFNLNGLVTTGDK